MLSLRFMAKSIKARPSSMASAKASLSNGWDDKYATRREGSAYRSGKLLFPPADIPPLFSFNLIIISPISDWLEIFSEPTRRPDHLATDLPPMRTTFGTPPATII